MEKIISIANSFFAKLYISCRVPADKQAHTLAGFIIAAVLTLLIGWYSVALVAVMALAKEIYDYTNKSLHTPDVWDFVVTALGGMAGYGFTLWLT